MQNEEKKDKKKALIIGISDYGDNLPSLDFCKNDAEEMYGLLKSLVYEIDDNNKLTGEVKWGKMRDTIIEFFTGKDRTYRTVFIKIIDIAFCCVFGISF